MSRTTSPSTPRRSTRRPSTPQRISTEKRTAPTGWPGAPWRIGTRRTIRATGSRRIANTLTFPKPVVARFLPRGPRLFIMPSPAVCCLWILGRVRRKASRNWTQGGIMDDNHRIAELQQAREMETARPQSTDEAVQGRMARLDVSQELARYLLDLETRIWELEMDLKELKQRPNQSHRRRGGHHTERRIMMQR